MPPKTPALRFRPRYVARTAPGEAEPNALPHRSTNHVSEEMSSLPEDDIDNLNLVQLERLRRRAEQETSIVNSTETDNSNHVAVSQIHEEVQSASNADSMGKHGDKKINVGHSITGATGCGNANEKTSLSAHAQLQRAVERFVDVGAFPEVAPRLPCNTMSSSLCNSALANSHGERIFNPIPLTDANYCSNLAESSNNFVSDYTEDSMQCHTDEKSNVVSKDSKYNNIIKTNETTLNKEANIIKDELADQLKVRNVVNDSVATERAVVDGTQFLRAHLDETRDMYCANEKFVQEVIKLQVSDDTLDPHACAHNGMLTWMQMPQFGKEDEPFQFEQLGPGKVGELMVMRSGRMILEVGGVEYEMSVESEVGQFSSSSDTGANSHNSNYMEISKGVHAVAVATSGESNVSMQNYNEINDDEESSHQINLCDKEHAASGNVCVELGVLQQKLVCTPLIDKLESSLIR